MPSLLYYEPEISKVWKSPKICLKFSKTAKSKAQNYKIEQNLMKFCLKSFNTIKVCTINWTWPSMYHFLSHFYLWVIKKRVATGFNKNGTVHF